MCANEIFLINKLMQFNFYVTPSLLVLAKKGPVFARVEICFISAAEPV